MNPQVGPISLPCLRKVKNISFDSTSSTFTIEVSGYYEIDYLMSAPLFYWTTFGIKVNDKTIGQTIIQQNIWQDQVGFPPSIIVGITTPLVSETRKIVYHSSGLGFIAKAVRDWAKITYPIWLAATIDLSIDRSSPIARYGGRHDLRHLNGLAHPNR